MLTVRSVTAKLLRWSPAQAAAAYVNRKAFACLAYHSVPDEATFARHMDYVAAHYRPVDLDAVIACVEGRGNLPPRAVLVTFDDGDASIVERALPVLQKRGIPAVLFVVVGQVGSQRPYWWDEAAALAARGARVAGWSESEPQALVRRLKRESQQRRLSALEELRASTGGAAISSDRSLSVEDLRSLEEGGVRVENHTLTHPSLDRCDVETVSREIDEAHAMLATMLGREPVAFAYPGGFCDEPARTALAARGYRAAFLFDHKLNYGCTGDPLTVSRLRIDADASVDRLAIILSGLHSYVLNAAGRL